MNHTRVIYISSGRHAQALHIEIHVFHIIGWDIQLVVEQAHHTSLVDLPLSFANLLGVSAIGHAHITAESQFYSQVGMLCLIARKTQLQTSSFIDVVSLTTDAKFRIIALSGQCLNLVSIDGHNLSHTYMSQGDTNRTEQVFWSNAISIPLIYLIIRFSQLVFFAIRKLKGLKIICYPQFSFWLNPIDGIVMNDTSIVGEKGTVLTGDIDQGGSKAISTRSSLCP